jgi:hypothetical protein
MREDFSMQCLRRLTILLLTLHAVTLERVRASALEWIGRGSDSNSFLLESTKQKFTPWGFNYDHDEQGRLIEDYWESQWPKVEEDFREMKQLGANVVRIHLQFAKFVSPTNRVNEQSLAQLQRLVQLAERTGLYLDVTGLGCYHQRDWAAWYDALSESERWAAQALFWRAIAKQCRNSPAIFCYDLMNEPVIPGGKQTNWLAGAFGGKHFVQFISRDPRGRKRPDIARAWTEQLTAAVRAEDPQHLITIGLVDWSLDRPGLNSGFVPTSVIDSLDFLAVHIYPERGKVDDALTTLKGFWRRQTSGDRGNISAEVFDRRVQRIRGPFQNRRVRLDRLLLGARLQTNCANPKRLATH